MEQDALMMRDNGPVCITNLKDSKGLESVISHIKEALKSALISEE